MQYHLRTLLILMAIGPPMLAGAWFGCLFYRENQRPQPAVDWMTVTPPMVIQEEEEFALGIEPSER